MTQVRLVTDNGDEQTLSMLALGRRLDDPATCADAVTALVHRGRARVILKGGHRATVTYATPPAATPSRGVPRLTGGTRRDYEINAELMFGIPAHVSVPGVASPQEAAELAREVLTGAQPPPDGFRVEISQDTVEDFITGLDIALDGAPRTLGVLGMHIVDINERLLLTHGDAP